MIDLDGTLLDTIRDLAAATNLMLEHLGHAPLPLEVVRTFVGKGIPQSSDFRQEALPLSFDFGEKLIDPLLCAVELGLAGDLGGTAGPGGGDVTFELGDRAPHVRDLSRNRR